MSNQQSATLSLDIQGAMACILATANYLDSPEDTRSITIECLPGGIYNISVIGHTFEEMAALFLDIEEIKNDVHLGAQMEEEDDAPQDGDVVIDTSPQIVYPDSEPDEEDTQLTLADSIPDDDDIIDDEDDEVDEPESDPEPEEPAKAVAPKPSAPRQQQKIVKKK